MTRCHERRRRFRMCHVYVLTNVIFVMCQNLRVESQNSNVLLYHRQLRHFASFPLSESTHWADSVPWNVHLAMGFKKNCSSFVFVHILPEEYSFAVGELYLRERNASVGLRKTHMHSCRSCGLVSPWRRWRRGWKKNDALFSYFSVKNCGLRHLQSTHPTAQQLSHRVAALVECVCMVHLILWTSSTAIASIVETESRDLELRYGRFIVLS